MSDVSSVYSDKTHSSNSECNDNSTYVEKNFVPEIFFVNNQRQFRYFKMIDKYFRKCDQNLIDKMVKIIDKNNENGDCISLRVLEWVVTKCSKKNVDIKIEDKEYFSINIMYKAQLKSYKKKNFDPFRRDKKFYFPYDKDDSTKTILTTLGQLNFFKWAISSNIIASVEKNYEQINKTMIHYNKEEKTKKVEKKKRKEKKKISIITSNKNNNLYMNTTILDESNKSNKSNKSNNTTRTSESKERFMINFN